MTILLKASSSHDAADENQRRKRRRQHQQEVVVVDFDDELRQQNYDENDATQRLHVSSLCEALSISSLSIDSDGGDGDCSSVCRSNSLINGAKGLKRGNEQGHYSQDFPIGYDTIKSCHSNSSSKQQPIWFGVGLLFGFIIQLIALSLVLSQSYNHQRQQQPYFKDLNNNRALLLSPTVSCWWIIRSLLSQLDLILDTIIWVAFTVTLVRTRMVPSSYSTELEVGINVQNKRNFRMRNTATSYATLSPLIGYSNSKDSHSRACSFFIFLLGSIVGSLVAWVCYNHVIVVPGITTITAEAVIRMSWYSIVQTFLVNGMICLVTIFYACTNREMNMRGDALFFTGEEKPKNSNHDLRDTNNGNPEAFMMIL